MTIKDCGIVRGENSTQELALLIVAEYRLGKREFGAVNLGRADLSEQHLPDIQLQGADLRGAKFVNTNLSGANFAGADCREVEFIGADLREAIFENANLSRANLADSILGGARFDNASLSGARVGDEPFKLTLDGIAEISKNARSSAFAFLSICAFFALTFAQLSDADLITNSGTFKIPLVEAQTSIHFLLLAAPMAVLGLQLALYMYTLRLCALLACLPLYFSDAAPRQYRVYPWLITLGIENMLARRSPVPRLLAEQPPTAVLQSLLTFVVLHLLAPAAIAFALWRSSATQDRVLLDLNLALLVCTCAASASLWLSRWSAKRMPRVSRSIVIATLVGYAACVAWVNRDGFSGFYRLNLDGACLRYANLSGKKLMSANLHGADLLGANLQDVDLSDADLTEANLTSADLSDADLTRATILEAWLDHTKPPRTAGNRDHIDPACRAAGDVTWPGLSVPQINCQPGRPRDQTGGYATCAKLSR